MGFTDLLSRLPLGKALPTSHYDEDFVVASIDKIQNILSNSSHFNSVDVDTVDRPPVAVKTNTTGVENSSDMVGQDFLNSSLAYFKVKIIVATKSCFARSIKKSDHSHTRTERCTSKCLPMDN